MVFVGGGCVGARRNSFTIPTVGMLRDREFFFPDRTLIVVKLFTLVEMKDGRVWNILVQI